MMCEICWGKAFDRAKTNPLKSQAEHYFDLLQEAEENNEPHTLAKEASDETT